VLREEGGFRLAGGGLAERVSAAGGDDDARARALDELLRQTGLLDRLRRAGARDGSPILVGDEAFTYHPDEE
jgi:hypothetical protein